jgi:hypothetical protein
MSDQIYAAGDIVILETKDAMFGKVTVPAIVRHYDQEEEVYEVNAFIVPDPRIPATTENCHWWSVSENEIKCKVGENYVER